MSERATILDVEGLFKAFGATAALSGVSLQVRAGEVHALLGHNGSGKSTLIKILSGYHLPDAGVVSIRGKSVRLPLPAAELRRLGIAFVHQDLGLVESMSVLENLRVGRYETGPGRRIRWRRERERARGLLRQLNLDADPDTPVAKLSVTQRAIVAVMRALQDVEVAGGGLLVLDEPTAALPGEEIDLLFAAVRRIAASGAGVLLVTHDVDDVFKISDTVTVLRDGRAVASRPTSTLTHASLIELIVGRALGELYPAAGAAGQDMVLEVANLRGEVADGVFLHLHKGEILGLTGLIGAGHDEVPYLIYGAQQPREGTVAVEGRPLDPPAPERCMRAGVVLVPADRQRLSTIPRATVRENVTLPALRSFRGRVGIDHRGERRAVAEALQRFAVRPPDPERALRTLSGGNQQKAVMGRWLRMSPRVMLLHEPTQGIDIGARQTIFQILRESASQGTSILYSSAEHEDLAHVCDRVLVLRKGRVVSELKGESLRQEEIATQCYAKATGEGHA